MFLQPFPTPPCRPATYLVWISRHCLRSWICPGSQADVGLIWKNVSKKQLYTIFWSFPNSSPVFNLQLHFCVQLFNQSPNLRPVYYSRQHISNIPVTYKARLAAGPHSDSDSPALMGKPARADRWITGMFTSTEGLVDELVRRLRIRAFGPNRDFLIQNHLSMAWFFTRWFCFLQIFVHLNV